MAGRKRFSEPVEQAPSWLIHFGKDREKELERARAFGLRIRDPLARNTLK